MEIWAIFIDQHHVLCVPRHKMCYKVMSNLGVMKLNFFNAVHGYVEVVAFFSEALSSHKSRQQRRPPADQTGHGRLRGEYTVEKPFIQYI